ncbi:MAG: hypothetical protein WBV11_02620 [Salegentibacter sp.]
MKSKINFLMFLIFPALYPAFSLYKLLQLTARKAEVFRLFDALTSFQLSIWICWVFFAAVGVYYKWTRKGNFVFYLTYLFLFIGFALFGFFMQKVMVDYHIKPSFGDVYSRGTLTAILNLGYAVALTAFLQAAVWWFTRKWHRR